MKPDFSGYASKAGLKCADGHTILAHAFKDQDGKKVPLIWKHIHDDPDMVLGHTVIEDRADGTYVYGYFNDSPMAQKAKRLLQHGDIDSMSIYAGRLVKRESDVVHGLLHEVSLVLAGANPGARIENVALQHSDGRIQEIEDEAIITTGLTLEHSVDSNEGDDVAKETDADTKLIDIYRNMSDEEKTLVHYLANQKIEDALEQSAESDEDVDGEDSEDSDEDDSEDTSDQSDESDDSDDTDEDDSDNESDDSEDSDDADESVKHEDTDSQESTMAHNVFDQKSKGNELAGKGSTLSHAQVGEIFADVPRYGSLKKSFLAHAEDYGIKDINILFPDAKTLTNTPEFDSRRMEWVSKVLGQTNHAPFSRIKSLTADITADEARAKGYVTGTKKKDEVFSLLKRVTTPTTVYKKQRLDRDDKLDITDFDVVVYLKAEMRLMLEEELARAILLGDGRSVSDPDKIKDPAGAPEGAGIRSIANDDDLYAVQVQLNVGTSVASRINELIRARSLYRGSGNPTLFTTQSFMIDMLLHEDRMGRRIYNSVTELAAALLAKEIVYVDPMEDHQDIVGIYVNLRDYTVGTDRGGEIAFFDDFDLEWNQEHYLLETRSSGALTKLRSAIVVRRALGTIVEAVPSPDFDGELNLITIPSKTGVVYTIDGETKTGDVEITKDTIVEAKPAEGYDFKTGITTSWPFLFTASGE